MTSDNSNISLKRFLSKISIKTSMDEDVQRSKSKVNEIKKIMLKIETYVKY